jgi:Tfp pilus assembly protein PilV
MNKSTRSARTRRQRGSAMLFSLAVLLVMSISGLGLAAATMQALYFSRQTQRGSIAFNVAESGAERAVLWLRQQSSPPSNTSPWNPFSGAQSLGAGSYTVTITPDANNANIDLKRYAVRSVGVAYNRQETVELYVQLANFGRYAYFTDFERSSITNSAIWFKAGEVIDGPAHSNNSSGTDFHINYNGSTTSIFKDTLTAVSNNINYNPGIPTTEAQYQQIYAAGALGFRLGVNRIELPVNTSKQRNAAWGATSGFPTSTGVYVPNSGGSTVGGIYINGDSTVTFSEPSDNWQRITIVQGSTTTTITIRLDSNQTVVQVGSTTNTYSGVPNGVIYSTGHITSLSGRICDGIVSSGALVRRNAYTIATDVVNGKNVTITGNLFYETVPDKTRAWDHAVNLRAPALGVVARNITISTSAPTDMHLHGVMLAGARDTTDGSFSAEAYNTRAIGRLNLIGGLIQKARGPVGTFNSSTGTQVSGFDKNYVYDRRMAVNPPPFFPTTGNYERLSFRRLSAGPYP